MIRREISFYIGTYHYRYALFYFYKIKLKKKSYVDCVVCRVVFAADIKLFK